MLSYRFTDYLKGLIPVVPWAAKFPSRQVLHRVASYVYDASAETHYVESFRRQQEHFPYVSAITNFEQ
jgi:hypothetical protein